MRVPTILVVENDPIVRNLIVHALTGLGFRVFKADSVAEALLVCNALKGQPLDLAIDGETSPRDYGRELAARIVQSCPNVKILHLSSLPFHRLQEENAVIPGSSFLQKPFTTGQLIAAVQNAMAARTQ